MDQQRLIPFRVDSRKNLLDFVSEYFTGDLYAEIGKSPKRWVEELSIVSSLLTGRGLCGGTGAYTPPIEDPELRRLGDNSFLYLGKNSQNKGLWVREESAHERVKVTPAEWTLYRLGTRANLFVHPSYQDVHKEDLLPENFERTAERVQSIKGRTKRPIWRFRVKREEGDLEVYAKGSDTSVSLLINPQSFRLTRIGGISRTTSEREMKTCFELRKLGINVPRVVGHYKSDIEQFLFLEAVKGKHPSEWLPDYKQTIIEQDARMLAGMFLGGYVKNGFEDNDDKVFDGNRLWLVDVDECRDLYFIMAPDFRRILLNPKDTKALRRFRTHQRGFFKNLLRDTLYNYRGSLLQEQADKESYIHSFFDRMGWKSPSPAELERLTAFKEGYQTIETYIGVMSEE